MRAGTELPICALVDSRNLIPALIGTFTHCMSPATGVPDGEAIEEVPSFSIGHEDQNNTLLRRRIHFDRNIRSKDAALQITCLTNRQTDERA